MSFTEVGADGGARTQRLLPHHTGFFRIRQRDKHADHPQSEQGRALSQIKRRLGFILHNSSFIFASSRRRFPDGVVEVFEDLLELAVEEFVQTGEAAAFAFEDEGGIIQCGAVHKGVGFRLSG